MDERNERLQSKWPNNKILVAYINAALTYMRGSRSLERFQFVYIVAASILGEEWQKVPITRESNKQNVSARIFN